MSEYHANEKWSFSWVVPVFNAVGATLIVGLAGLVTCAYIVGVVAVNAIKETFAA